VIEHRSLLELSLSKDKSLSCVIKQLVIWDYIFVELSLEVQGGQDYFRFVEGTCIIACVLSSSVLYIYPLQRLWTHSDSEPENSSIERKRRSFQKHNSTPPSCGFSHLHKPSHIIRKKISWPHPNSNQPPPHPLDTDTLLTHLPPHTLLKHHCTHLLPTPTAPR